jgi:signal transduction histidine kinase
MRRLDFPCDSDGVRSQPARFWVTDGVIAAAFVTAGQLELHYNDGSGWIGHASLAISVPFVAAMAAPLLFRRAAPFAALCLVAAAVAPPRLFADVTLPLWGGLGAFAFAVYSCSRHAGRPLDRYALLAPAFTLAMLSFEIRGFASLSEYSFSVPVFVLAWLIGQGLRRWERNSAVLREHIDDITATEQARAASAVADERARIARELHDVVAHSISVMVIQAGSARLRLGTDTSASEQALHSVEQTGRQALAEMRRMLGVLRTDDQGLALMPQPGLGGLDQLLDQMRDAGLSVEAHVEGVPVMLPPGLDLSAYRIVQEALTNVLKHAGHTSATVRVAYQPDRLLLDITNQPGTTVRTRVNGGHGIIGMRERAALFGGSMKAEPQPGGGYKVQAAIPLPSPERT